MISNALLFLSILGGALIPIQAATNAKLANYFGHPILAATTSTLVSFSTLLVLSTILIFTRTQFNSTQVIALPLFFLLGGGIIGAYVVFISLTAAPILGVTTLFAALLAGQLVISVILDHYGILGLNSQKVDLQRLIGISLLIAGVYFVRKN
tara:strand:+ start:5098 stop:5553 length:456 start_codon:yes stop_codon:yes gene_type:complete